MPNVKDIGLDTCYDICPITGMGIEALKEAIRRAGNQTKLAEAIGVTQGHVSQWLHRKKVPAEKVVPIEKATGIPRQSLRPDIFGDA